MVRIFILFLNAEKVWPIVNYRLETEVSGRCMMYVRVAHFCLMADGQKFKTKNLRVVLICYWQNQRKVWNKMQEDRQDCTLFICIEICEKHIIQTSVVLSVCEMLFHAFSLGVVQSQLRANDLRILPRESWSFQHQHDALILNWLPFVHYITIKLRLSAWNDDVWTFWYSIRRYTSVSVTYIILGGIITFCHTFDFSKSHRY